MNMKEIKELLQLMKENSLTEIELEKDGLKLKLKKNGHGQGFVEQGEGPAMVIPMPQATGPVQTSGTAVASDQEDSSLSTVKSPMVGTFYSSPSPDQPAYVSAGQSVKKGDVLCIIEAMKLMNEIKCEVSGVITEILPSNGQAVEFDQPLFKIKKA